MDLLSTVRGLDFDNLPNQSDRPFIIIIIFFNAALLVPFSLRAG